MDRHLGEGFKWLFYGDDDTVFLVEAAMNIVRTPDPDLPYFLTGGPSGPAHACMPLAAAALCACTHGAAQF